MENNQSSQTMDIQMTNNEQDFQYLSNISKKEVLDTFVKIMMLPKQHLTSAPTFNPVNFYEQIQFYDDGTNRRIYLYINNTWRYVTLT